MKDDSLKLSQAEITEGWHFCVEFDGLLVGPGMGELTFCACLTENHPAYDSINSSQDTPFT